MILKDGSILNASWPQSAEVDNSLLTSSQYLMDSSREFRLRLKNMLTTRKVF